MNPLEYEMDRFLAQRMGAERIDDLPGAHGVKRADYFLGGRRVIVEVKSIDDDRRVVMQRVIDRWRSQLDWPRFAPEASFVEIVTMHPRGQEFAADFERALFSSTELLFRNANRQIRETARAFDIQPYLGLLVILNHGVDLFDTATLAHVSTRHLQKVSTEDLPRFECIDSVLCMSSAHVIDADYGTGRPVMGWITRDEETVNDRINRPEWYLMREWAAYLGLDLVADDSIRTAHDLAARGVKGLTRPILLGGDRLPPPGDNPTT